MSRTTPVAHRPPSWTDANVHDPGVTLVELLAYGLVAFTLVYWWWRRHRCAGRDRPA
jgi:hypothetical protein